MDIAEVVFTRGEKALLASILELALLDLGHKELRSGVLEWLDDEEADSEEPFTFRWICAQLDFNREYILRGMDEFIKGTRVYNHRCGPKSFT
jgi:hypothetical protein